MDSNITNSEIEEICLSLKNGKSSGIDSGNNEMLKASLSKLKKCFEILFNLILNVEKFPQQWSTGLIVPIFKGGKVYDKSNYRGISILSCLGKMFTGIINKRISIF